MSFIGDLKKSHEAVEVVTRKLTSFGYLVRTLTKAEQAKGDIEIIDGDEAIYAEVKFDIMAQRTGNLCFEISNGKKSTGVATTLASIVYYVVPQQENYIIYVFLSQKLRQYLDASPNVVTKNGGDGKRFVLKLVKMADIEADKATEAKYVVARG